MAIGRTRPYFVFNDVIFVPFFAAAFIVGDVIVYVAARGALWKARGRVRPIILSRLKQLVLKVRFP